jgi:hypothetical protein
VEKLAIYAVFSALAPTKEDVIALDGWAWGLTNVHYIATFTDW